VTVPTLEPDITDITAAGVFSLGNRTVNRMGYGAMQLAGPGVFGPPKDRQAAELDRGTVCDPGRASTSRPDPTARLEQRDLCPAQTGEQHRQGHLRAEPLQSRASRRRHTDR